MKMPSGTRLNVSRGAAALVIALSLIVTGSSWWLPDRQAAPVPPGEAKILAVAAPDIRLDMRDITNGRVDIRPPWALVQESDRGAPMLVSSTWQPGVPPAGAAWVEEQRWPGLVLGRWINEDVAAGEATSAPRAEDYDALLELSSVGIMRDDQVVHACTEAFGRHRCGPDGWNWVGPTTQMIAGQEQSCAWLHPHAAGALVLRFSVPAEYGRLDVQMALSDHAAGVRTEPIEVAVNLDGDGIRSTRSSLTVLPRPDWQSLEVVLAEGHTGTDVNIAITTDEPGLGHLCGRVSVISAHERSTATSSRRPRVSTARMEGLVRSRLRWMGLSTPRWMRVIRGLFREVAAETARSGVEQ